MRTDTARRSTARRSEARVAGVILAAGAATRFGSRKQEARVGEGTMLEAVVRIALASGLDPVLAVVPPGLAVPPDVVAVPNAEPERGLSLSVKLGIHAVPTDAVAAVLLLGDQPTLDPATVRRVAAARDPLRLIVAAHADGILGPPVLVEREAFRIVDRLAGDIGLREWLRANPGRVTSVDVDAHPPDIDTADDLVRVSPSADTLARRHAQLRRRLLASATGAPESGGDKEGPVVTWPLPVTVAHLARWDGVAVEELRKHLAGERTADYSDFAAWNRRWAEEDADVSLHEALSRWDSAFGAVLELVRQTPLGRWDAEALEWLNGCTFDHYAEHLAALDGD